MNEKREQNCSEKHLQAYLVLLNMPHCEREM